MLQKRTIIVVIVVIAYVVLTVLLILANALIIISALASVGLVIVTAALVLATYTYAEAANRQAAALTDPIVFLGVEDVANVDQFFVQNVGPGIAYDITFKVLKDFKSGVLVNGKKLSDSVFLKNNLKTLGPSQKIPFALIDSTKLKISFDETIEVEVSYKNKLDAKNEFKQLFPMNFAYYRGIWYVRETVPDQLKKIAESIQNIENKLE